MLEKLITEYEEISTWLEEADEGNIDRINYLCGMKQGIVNCMNIIDFKGAWKYFEGDDLPY